LRRVGEIDAAEFDPVLRLRDLGSCVIYAGHACASRERRLSDYPPESARGAGHDNNFSVHAGVSERRGEAVHTIALGDSFATA
jgi:hypothetical protein